MNRTSASSFRDVSSRPVTAPALVAAIVALAGVVFAVDLTLPLGIAVWVLYFGPVALSQFSWRPHTPLLTAAVCSGLMVAGFVFSPARENASAFFAPLNRGLGLVTLWVAAGIGRQFVVHRLAVRRDVRLGALQNALSMRMAGEKTQKEIGSIVLAVLVEQLGAAVGAFYAGTGDVAFDRVAQHASSGGADVAVPRVNVGEGLLGAVAESGRLVQLSKLPPGYLEIRSALGGHAPAEAWLVPFVVDGHVEALVELGFLSSPDSEGLELFPRIGEAVASAVRSAEYRRRQQELLEETQLQAEELQAQQEELRVQNEELEQQSQVLQDSQARLENQQAELEQINSELEQQTDALAGQRDGLVQAQSDLVRANTYKSEFLANMSHELRTPLNSSLILAKLLADNRKGNLDAEQVKFAETIYSAGNDLLTLINDILDLSKIEAGKLDVRSEKVALRGLVGELVDVFRPVALERGLEFEIQVSPELVEFVQTDSLRAQQILRNLLSNAFKFTERGGVVLTVRNGGLGVLFDVKDTGIGIAAENHDIVFEAFRQADGTTNRKYGGTGLGLSISRDLARRLGGELSLDSAPGRGSTFTLALPLEHEVEESAGDVTFRLASALGASPSNAAAGRSAHGLSALERAGMARRGPAPGRQPMTGTPDAIRQPAPALVDDDRAHIEPGSRAILVIEDDESFAKVLVDAVRECDFRALAAATAEDGLLLAARYRPSAIVLDIGLPDRSGLSVLDALKHDPMTRHIPVHVLSASDYTRAALEMGAAGYAIKPVAREQVREALERLEARLAERVRRVLVVEDDPVHLDSTRRLLESDGVEIVPVASGKEALSQLGQSTFDCMVLDLSLPDQSGLELLEEMAREDRYSFPPVIVYTGRSLSREDEHELRRFSQSIIIKGARSPERLLDEVTLFLHQVEADLPPERRRMLEQARHREAIFDGCRILIVEDDVRNIFALSSILEPKGAKVEIARNGKEALAQLAQNPRPDLVLMDIMMPEMDGFEAMRQIRRRPEWAKLPVIALTAKAMLDDRENCLKAGANDYIAKPLDVDKLLSLARVWMRR